MDTFYSFEEQLVVVYHFKRTVDNKQLENLIAHLVSSRSLHHKPTLVLSEIELPSVRQAFESQSWPCYKSGGVAPTTGRREI